MTEIDEDKLKLLGWARRMQVPGEIEQFQATRTEHGTIKLTWQRCPTLGL
ncbi:MAG: hypothetical protein GDA43_02525 [Hormoscilla sp. SP5CHS1]|nr:hypothetical protein [Hormoscilla sp. SP5CHS1]